jgi:O-antigen ligase
METSSEASADPVDALAFSRRLFIAAIVSLAIPLGNILDHETRILGFSLTSAHNLIIVLGVTPYVLDRGFRRLANPIILSWSLVLLMSFTLSSRYSGLSTLQSFKSFGALVLGLVLFEVRLDDRAKRTLCVVVQWMATICLAAGCLLHLVGYRPAYWMDLGAFRLQGAAVPAQLSQMGVVGMMAGLALDSRRRATWLVLFNFFLVTWSGTRMGILEGLIVISTYFLVEVYSSLKGKPLRRRQSATLLGGALLVLLSYSPVLMIRFTALHPWAPEAVVLTLPDIFGFGDEAESDEESTAELTISTAGRLAAWRFFWEVAQDDLWFGRGIGTSVTASRGHLHWTYTAPHNEYLRTIVDGGFVGLGLILVGFSLLIVQLARDCPPAQRLALFLAFSILALDCATRNTLITQQFSVCFWLFISLLVYPPDTSQPTD